MVRFNGQWRSQNARTLKKLRTLKGDYCIKQWFSTIKEQFLGVWKITFTTLGELPWVLLFSLRTCVNCVKVLRQWWYLDPLLCHQLKNVLSGSANDQCAYFFAFCHVDNHILYTLAQQTICELVSTREGFIVTFWLGEGGYQMVWKKYKWCFRR